MNIHPALVHFPIALLMVYAVLEVGSRIPRFRSKVWLEPMKAFLVIVGTLAALVTLSSGETAEHAILDRSLRPLIRLHASFATTATYVFAFIAGVYLLRLIQKEQWYARIPRIIQTLFTWYLFLLDRAWVLVAGAILGLVAVTITGALGGAIVYGSNADPIVHAIYSLFF